jgi:hypothetical protein
LAATIRILGYIGLECYLIDQFEVAFKSQASYYSLLKESKISWRKAQPKNPLQDPEMVKKKNQEIQDIITGLLPEIKAEKVVILYTIDEVHPLEGDLISHLWGKTDKRLKLPLLNPKNRQTYYGALNLINPELITGEYKQGNGDCTVYFLNTMLFHVSFENAI